MTNTHFLYELNMLVDDAIAFLKNGKIERATATLESLAQELDDAYERACNEGYENVPDEVDESNYNPFTGCDERDDYSAEYLGWDV